MPEDYQDYRVIPLPVGRVVGESPERGRIITVAARRPRETAPHPVVPA